MLQLEGIIINKWWFWAVYMNMHLILDLVCLSICQCLPSCWKYRLSKRHLWTQICSKDHQDIFFKIRYFRHRPASLKTSDKVRTSPIPMKVTILPVFVSFVFYFPISNWINFLKDLCSITKQQILFCNKAYLLKGFINRHQTSQIFS